jgi:hypothetical protein
MSISLRLPIYFYKEMKMKNWEYDISFHSIEELGVSETDFPSEQVVACDTEGHCFFNDVMKPSMEIFRELLNERGTEGWELVQAGYHRGSLVCFWKREKP